MRTNPVFSGRVRFFSMVRLTVFGKSSRKRQSTRTSECPLDPGNPRCSHGGANDGSGSTSARRGPIDGGLLRHFNVGPGSASFGRSTSVPKSSTTHRAKHSGDEHMKSEPGFNDPPNVAAVASKRVLCGRGWIDAEDSAWQFHGSQCSRQEGDALVASLENIVALDDTIRDLADPPVGCHACRTGGRRAFLERSCRLS